MKTDVQKPPARPSARGVSLLYECVLLPGAVLEKINFKYIYIYTVSVWDER